MTFQFEKLDHVQLAMPFGEENKARAFYQGILGLEEVEKPKPLQKNGGVWFTGGQVNIHIGVEQPFVPAKKAHPAILVDHLEVLKKHLMNKKWDFIVDKNLPGANRIYVFDIFGNRLEFLEWIL